VIYTSHVIKLTPEDIQRIVAEKYNVDIKNVDVLLYMTDVGYGMGERKEPTFEVHVNLPFKECFLNSP
jgi:hypothetical protein